MMKDLYKKYFQKSTTFLYPFLKLKKGQHPRPKKTYISFGDSIHYTDRKLICVYETKDTDVWRDFEASILMTHPMLDSVILIEEENSVVYVFDFDTPDLKDDFDNFIIGKYSQFSKEGKKRITDYYGIQTAEWVYIESYIHPKKYFKTYAKILSHPIEELQKVGELCNKYNSEKEHCILKLT